MRQTLCSIQTKGKTQCVLTAQSASALELFWIRKGHETQGKTSQGAGNFSTHFLSQHSLQVKGALALIFHYIANSKTWEALFQASVQASFYLLTLISLFQALFHASYKYVLTQSTENDIIFSLFYLSGLVCLPIAVFSLFI